VSSIKCQYIQLLRGRKISLGQLLKTENLQLVSIIETLSVLNIIIHCDVNIVKQ
jgi:hypothetical protein